MQEIANCLREQLGWASVKKLLKNLTKRKKWRMLWHETKEKERRHRDW